MAKVTGAGATEHKMPRWVKYSLFVAIVLIVGVVAMLMAGGHGPWQHQAPAHTPMAHG